jgi:hypothetical protein
MRSVCAFLLSGIFILNTQPIYAQQPSPSAPNPSVLLQQSLAAALGSQTITDVTLSGTVQYIAGSYDESGTAVLKTVATGASSVSLTLPSGQRSEIQNCSGTPPVGVWSGPDGVSHAIAYHNLLICPAWFFPAFTIAHGLSSSSYAATYVGPETHNGQAVQHVSFSQASLLAAAPGAPSSAHLTQVDLFLDSTTLLPAAIDFKIHPDNNVLVDIPIEVRFSDYRAVNGAQVPFHIQKYLNNSLTIDFQPTSVTFNSGLTASSFSL